MAETGAPVGSRTNFDKPKYICRLQRSEPGSSDPLRDEICGLRGINWDGWMAKLAIWLLRHA